MKETRKTRRLNLVFGRIKGRAKGNLKKLAVVLQLALGVCWGVDAYGLDINALPAGGQVKAGQAVISQSGSRMDINQSTNKAVINWQTFNIGQNAWVNFNQPSSSSSTLNRVLTSDPSQIYGRLTANGQVFLLNPNGLVFGRSASVNVGGLLGSTMKMDDNDFMNGVYKLYREGSSGSILNYGSLTAADRGFIALLAPEVRNEGIISAKMGTVAIGAGEKVSLDFTGDELMTISVDSATVKTLIENKHLITAEDGRVIMSASAADKLIGSTINNEGAIEAKSLVSEGGVIKLVGNTNIVNSGKIDASGATGGGTVLLGGDAHGAGDLPHAQSVTMTAGATIDASATDTGKGGKVVLWSDGVTQMDGAISAKGGPNGGNGGFVETSGHTVNIGPGAVIDTLAPMGAAGDWLIDPYDITVASSGGNITGATIATALNSSNITLDTTNVQYLVNSTNTNYTSAPVTGGNGDITINDAISKTGSSATTFTLKAHNDININQAITSSSGRLNVVLTADQDGSNVGNINFGASGRVVTKNGNFYAGSISGTQDTMTAKGQNFTMATGSYIDAGRGNLDISVKGNIQLPDNSGQTVKYSLTSTYEDGSVSSYRYYVGGGSVYYPYSPYQYLKLSTSGGNITTANANASNADIVTSVETWLSGQNIGSSGTPLKISGPTDPYGVVSNATYSTKTFVNTGKTLYVTNTAGSSYINEIGIQNYSNINVTVGSQASNTQNIQIMGDAGGDGTTGTGHIILNTDGSGVLTLTANNIKTAGVAGISGSYTSTPQGTDPSIFPTSVSITAPNITFATNSVDTGTSVSYYYQGVGTYYKQNYGMTSYAASFTANGTTSMASSQVDNAADIKAVTLNLTGPSVGTAANPVEIGSGSTLTITNSGGSTYVKSTDNSFGVINLYNYKSAGTHSILFSGGDHIDYSTNGSGIIVPTIGARSDGSTFNTTGIDVSGSNRSILLTANSGYIEFDTTSVNTGAGNFTTSIYAGNADRNAGKAIYAKNAKDNAAEITAANVTFNMYHSSTAGAISDMELAQGAGTSNNTLTVNTYFGNVDIRELTSNHFKTLNVTLNGAHSNGQNVAIDLNGPDDVNFTDTASLLNIDSTKVNLSSNNRNWNLQTPSRTVQIDSNSLGTGSYTVNAGTGLKLNADVLTNGGAISLTGGGSHGIQLLKTLRVDSNADDLNNTASTGASGSIYMSGMISSTGGSRTLTVDSSSADTSGGQIQMYSGTSNAGGAYLTGLTLTARGSSPTYTNDGAVYLYNSSYLLNGNLSSTGNNYLQTGLTIDTEQGNVASGGNITFAGSNVSSYTWGSYTFNTSTTAAGMNGGNIDFYGTYNHSTLYGTGFTATATGGTGGTAGNISLPAMYSAYSGYSNIQSYTGGIITLNGNLNTHLGSVTLNGDVRLANSVAIDTWNGTNSVQTATAGAVIFSGTGISATGTSKTLTIDTSTNTGTTDRNTSNDANPDPAIAHPASEYWKHTGGAVTLNVAAGNAGGSYLSALTINTTKGGSYNNGSSGVISLKGVTTTGAQTYTGGGTTLGGDLTSNGGNINLSGASALTLTGSGGALAIKTDMAGGSTAAGTLNIGTHNLNGALALTIDTTADGGGTGADLTLNSVGNSIIPTSLSVSSKALTLNGPQKATGNILLAANTMTLGANTIQSTGGGTLTVKPSTANTTIGIAGGTGTLQLTAGNFSTNFVDGFSKITVGDSSAGAVTVGGATTVTDNLELISGGNITLNSALSASGQTLTLTGGSGATVSGSGNLTADKLLLNGTNATYTLNTATANNIGTLAATGANSVSFKNAAGLSVGTVSGVNGVGASNDIILQSSGGGSDLTLNQAVTSTAGNVVLASGRNFINNVGAGGVSANGANKRWLIWSANPANDTRGGLSYDFKQYNAVYGTTTVAGGATQKGFLYTLAPTINASLTGSITKVYDGNTTATLTAANYTSSGAIDGDTATLNNPASGTYDTKHAGTAKTVTASGLAVAGATNGAATVYGYQMSSTAASGAIGSVTKAPLTIAAATGTKTYDGTTSSSATPTVSGLKGSDTVTDMTEVYSNKNAGTGLTMSVAGYTINDGNSGNNYSVNTSTNTTGVINKASLTMTANDAAKVLTDVDPTLTARYSGFVNGETFPVLSGISVSRAAGESAGNYAITPAAASASNYTIFPVAGTFTIQPADKLLIRVSNASNTYGSAVGALTTLDAKYYSSTGTALRTMTLTNTGGNNYSGNDGLGTTFTFSLASTATATSDVGNYAITVANFAKSGNNFTGQGTQTGYLTVNPLAAALSAGAITKVYDGTTKTSGASLSVSNKAGADDVSVNFSSAYNSKNVGNAGYTAANLSLTGIKAGNYYLAQSTISGAGTITAKPLSLVNFDAANKVYDGTTAATINTTGTLSGIMSGDTVTFSNGSATFTDKNAGSGKTVTLAGITLGGADSGNYSISATATDTANITAKAITANSITAANKVYDGTTVATLITGAAGLTGVVGGDTVSLVTGSTRGAFADKNAGTGKSVAVAGLALSGADAGNYTVSDASNATADITKAPLTMTANDAAKVLTDVDPTLTARYTGFVNGENTGVLSGISITRAAGEGAGDYTITPSATAANYTINPANGLFTVHPADKLLISVSNATNIYGNALSAFTPIEAKYYSGADVELRTVPLTNTSGNSYSGDDGLLTTFTFDLSSAATSTSNVGNYSINIANFAQVGSNFSSQATQIGYLTVNPLAASLSPNSITKVYDGTTTTSGAAITISNKVGADDVSLNFSGAYNSRNVGNAGYTANNPGLSGAKAGNYYLDLTSLAGTGAITAKTITIGGITAGNKVYDRTTTAALNTDAASLSGLISGDTVNPVSTGASGAFADKNVGTGKSVTVSGLALSGADSGNYSLTQPAGVAADITKADLSVTGVTANNKIYDGTTTATLSGTASVAPIAGDTVTVGGTASAAFSNKNVGAGKTVTVTGYAIGGADAGNYNAAQPSGLTANITPKSLTGSIINNPTKTYDGNTGATLTSSNFSISGLVGSESAIVTKTSGTYNSKDVPTADTVTATLAGTDYSAGGGTDLNNYTLPANVSGAGIITKKTLTITAENKSKIQGNANPAFTALYAGFVGSENIAVINNLIIGSGASLASPAGSYPITASGAMADNYQMTYVAGALTVTASSTTTQFVPPPPPPPPSAPKDTAPISQPVIIKEQPVGQVVKVGDAVVVIPGGEVSIKIVDVLPQQPLSSQTGQTGQQTMQQTQGSQPAGAPQTAQSNQAVQIIAEVSKPTAFSFSVPKETVMKVAGSENALAKATLADGSALPAWLKFDGNSQTISAFNPPAGSLPIKVILKYETGSGKTGVVEVIIGERAK